MGDILYRDVDSGVRMKRHVRDALLEDSYQDMKY